MKDKVYFKVGDVVKYLSIDSCGNSKYRFCRIKKIIHNSRHECDELWAYWKDKLEDIDKINPTLNSLTWLDSFNNSLELVQTVSEWDE